MTEALTEPAAPQPAAPGAPGAGGPRRGDLTQGPILRTLLLFSIPTLISNLLQTLNGSINAMWVGRLIGESALAATANANVITFLLFSAVFGFGMATTVKVGQHFGARNVDAARRTFGAGTGFCTLVSLAVAIAGWFASPTLLRLMATPGGSMAEADAYLRVIFLSLPFGTATMMLSMGLRGAGDARTPLYAMILTVAIDVAFNPLLIRGIGPFPALGVFGSAFSTAHIPPLGIAGSALSTALANIAGVLLLVWVLYRKDLPLRLRGAELRYLRPAWDELGYIIGKGLPMGAQMLLIAAAQLVMVGLVNREGMDTTAAYGASMQLWNYLQMPAFAIGSAVSAMVAQAIGADNHRRAGAVTLFGVTTNLVMTGVLGLLIVTFDRPLLAIFLGHDSPAIPIARHIQLICTWSFMLSGVMMVMTGTMRAYGAVVVPLLILFVSFYPARMGFYFGTYHWLGSEALWWSYPASSSVALVLTVWAYTQGNWRHNRGSAYRAGGPPAD
ncbi:MATE family efflux transporter [Novosphingobium sp.]|uniref:MATE family efflux transporter n=1 Tax=Novosphingobium sp. TaxID=1874826 RepID=UPI002622BEEC|nr:MATE family efflux transporter [Novosphingobium sp.]